MSLAVVTVASKGLPVVEAVAGKLALPVVEATNGRGLAVTKVTQRIRAGGSLRRACRRSRNAGFAR